MKKIPNIITRIHIGDSKQPMMYSELAKAVASQMPQQGGITVAEMRERMRLLEHIEKSTDQIVLEDADHKKLVSLCGTMPWAFAQGC